MVHLPDASKMVKRQRAMEPQMEPCLKRMRFSSRTELGVDISPLLNYDVLKQPSPLGLRLKKSPSFAEMIETRLSLENSPSSNTEKARDCKPNCGSNAHEKMKASNFPVSLLRIGDWERVSKYEGDLVAKFYFSKHMLVWEVLDGGLKSKMEIAWSKIALLRANCPEDAPGTLEILLLQPPTFFTEKNPLPKKHTLWKNSPDFTGGQASRHRLHFLQCPQGLMDKHIGKLLQCEPRLDSPFLVDNPFFQPDDSLFEVSECLNQQECGGTERSHLTVQQLENSGLSQEIAARRTKNEVAEHEPMANAAGCSYRSFGEPNCANESSGFGVPSTSRSARYEMINQMAHHMYRQQAQHLNQFPGNYLASKENLEWLQDDCCELSRENSLRSMLQAGAAQPGYQMNSFGGNPEINLRMNAPPGGFAGGELLAGVNVMTGVPSIAAASPRYAYNP